MCSDCQSSETIIDVRTIAPRLRHPMIFNTFQNLNAGEAFLIVNDHDPKPLHYQFAAEYPDTFEWTYEQQGPEVWQVRVTRTAA
ncbi:DUF2249 domain-containing protein [Devosia sp. FKR38]|uniref:DUF2249 domain-containing protein n=1 Tax=Devosia sp. FKR38 TaxID=2562312 RepID=UPI0010C0CB3B|nr:DUF2249 domain-containing protein [Devosia sp. FKR38]